MAVELGRLGWDVNVLERSPQTLQDRGAAITVASHLFDTLLGRELIDRTAPHLRSTHIARVVRDDPHGAAGRVIWEQPTEVVHLRWHTLFQQLQQRVPQACYRSGACVQSFTEKSDGVEVRLADGEVIDCDLLIHADGHQSQGRRALFPSAEVRYAGYIIWRGLLPEQRVDARVARALRFSSVGYSLGHGVFYCVPGPDGSVEPGARSIFWALYMRAHESELAGMLTDSSGQPHRGSLPPDALPKASARELERRLRAGLPEVQAALVRDADHTFLQAVYDGPVPGYRKGRVLLAGDAGALAAPTSGAGALKAVHDAAALARRLAETPDSIDAALAAWDDERTHRANRAVEYGRELARALVLEIPDWAPMNATAMWRWLSMIVTHWDAVTPFEHS